MIFVWVVGFFVVVWLLGKMAGGQKAPAPRRYPSSSASGGTTSASSVALRPYGASPSRNREPGRWVPAGESVTIAGLTIDTGMIYVGGVLDKPNGRGTENCLIDPSLRVLRTGADTYGTTMSYWPSYGGITPQARLAYLQWLAGGRSDPNAGIGYVFLFFYGLERRVFVDKAEADYGAIIEEVRRLASIYGANGSFSGYARRLLEVLEVFHTRDEDPPPLSLDLRNGFDIPLQVSWYLGLRLKEAQPLTADDALLWAIALPDNFPRTPAQRCFTELCTLWRLKFATQWPNGLVLRAPQANLKIAYRPASGSFNGTFEADIPDISRLRTGAGLRNLFAECTDELDAYSRLIGRRPECVGTLEAAALLPRQLAEADANGPVARARAALEALLGDKHLVLAQTDALLKILGLSGATGDLRSAGGMLAHMGLGFEPDRRWGAAAPNDPERVALFRTDVTDEIPHSEELALGRIMIEMAALAAAADGVIAPEEAQTIAADIRGLAETSEGGRRRLQAYATALLDAPPRQQTSLNRLAKLPASSRKAAVEAALATVLADGVVSPGEVRFLERLFNVLALPKEELYGALHRGAVQVDEPVLVDAGHRTPGVAIPSEAPAKSGVTIDAAKLARVREQTKVVSTLLSQIFTEPDVAAVARVPIPPPVAAGFDGLDGPHSQLLADLLTNGPVAWPAFEAKARALKLLPDGAVETINDWGFDHFDEALIEPGDTIAVADHLHANLKTLEPAT